MSEDAPKRLILLEGAPATGKSTTAAYLHTRLPGSNLYTELGSENPIYDTWALMKHLIVPAGIELEEPEQSIVAAMPALSAEEFRNATLLRVKTFAGTSVRVNIFDGTFIGNTLLFLFLSFREDAQNVIRFIEEMIDAARPLNPLLVYYNRESAEEVLATIDDGRPGHGDWVVRLLAGSPYSRERGLTPTRRDLAAVLETLVVIVRDIYARLQIPKISIPMSGSASGDVRAVAQRRAEEWLSNQGRRG